MTLGFGRKQAPDARDKQFPMRLMLDPLRENFFPSGVPLGSRHYFSGAVLNQLETGTCVAHAWAAKVHAAPIMQAMQDAPYDFYRRIVSIDEWDDNDHESTAPDSQLQSGTSVRAGAKVLVDAGYASTYLWAENAQDVRAWILAGFGGVVLGTWWKASMMRTDSEGFISVFGANEGGHAYYVNGMNDRVKRNGRTVQAFRAMNSWGREWGQSGRFWITFDDLDRLIQDGGEACALTERRIPK